MLRNGAYELITTREQLRDIFAPIESADEALGYVVALTGRARYYGQEYDPAYEYEVDVIEDTHVETVDDGYWVHLFRYDTFGCGPHHTHALAYLVTREGEIVEETSEAIYRDPTEDDLCVD
jgi:hypothetical protein